MTECPKGNRCESERHKQSVAEEISDLKEFGESQSGYSLRGQILHGCPYAEEINDDFKSRCNCCEACTHECAMDI